MRILIFNWRDARHPQAGGAEVFVHKIGSIWSSQGHEVALIAARESAGPRIQDEFRGLTVVRVGGRFGVYLRARREYNQHWRGWPDAVVESINGVPFFTPLYTREPVLAVVYHIVGRIFFEELPLPFSAAGYAAERSLPFVYHDGPVVTISPSSRDELLRLGFTPSAVHVVESGLQLPGPSPSTARTQNLIASIGRLKRYKRLDLLIAAAAQVIREVPDARFHIAGRGDREAELRRLIESLRLSEHVKLLGFVSEEQKAQLLRSSKLLVSTSEKEGWGLNVLEAASYGTPTVALDAAGVRDAIVDGETGVLVTERDPGALARAIIELIQDEPRRHRIAERALARAAEFRWETTAREVMTLLERVERQRPATSRN